MCLTGDRRGSPWRAKPGKDERIVADPTVVEPAVRWYIAPGTRAIGEQPRKSLGHLAANHGGDFADRRGRRRHAVRLDAGHPSAIWGWAHCPRARSWAISPGRYRPCMRCTGRSCCSSPWDVRRYLPLVKCLAMLAIVFGAGVLLLDVTVGMPRGVDRVRGAVFRRPRRRHTVAGGPRDGRIARITRAGNGMDHRPKFSIGVSNCT